MLEDYFFLKKDIEYQKIDYLDSITKLWNKIIERCIFDLRQVES